MPSHSRQGYSDALPDTVMYDVGFLQPWSYQTYFDDFMKYTAADWTKTVTGTGTATQLAGITGAGGVVTTVNSAASGDSLNNQLVAANYFFDSGVDMAFVIRMFVDDVTNAQWSAGLTTLAIAPDAQVNGVYFNKPSGATTINFVVNKASTATTLATTATMTASTYTELGFFYDANKALFKVYQDGNQVAEQSNLTNVPLTTTPLALSFGVKNGTAAARTMNVDYVMAAKRRLATLGFWS